MLHHHLIWEENSIRAFFLRLFCHSTFDRLNPYAFDAYMREISLSLTFSVCIFLPSLIVDLKI